MKTAEIIEKLIAADLWKYCLVMFKRAETLDKYYRIYKLIRTKYPDREYGYLRKALNDDDIRAAIGFDKLGALLWSLQDVYWLIQEMERNIWV